MNTLLSLRLVSCFGAVVLPVMLCACGGGDGSSEDASASREDTTVTTTPWYSYDATKAPSASDAVVLPNNSSTTFTTVTGSGLSITGAGSLTVDTSAAAQTSTVEYDMVPTSDYPKYFTLLANVTGNTSGLRVTDFDVALANSTTLGNRVRLLIGATGTTGVQIESWDGTTTLSDASIDTSTMHIYQLDVTLTSATAGSFQLYVDGVANSTLKGSGALRATTYAGDNFVIFGAQSSSESYQGNIDWVVWSTDGAFTPSQVKGNLPSGLGTTTGY